MQDFTQNIETEEATPEEEQEYEQALDVALRALHSGGTAKKTVGRVLNGETPAKGVARAVFVLLRRVEEELGGLSDAVKIQIGEDLVMEILELMVASDRMKESEIDDQLIEDVVKEVYALYTSDAEQRGALDSQSVAADAQEGRAMMEGGEKPQGVNVMSNQEVQTRGLMNV